MSVGCKEMDEVVRWVEGQRRQENNGTRVQRMSRDESRYAKLNLGANNTL